MRVRVKERRMGVFARCRRKGYSYGLSRGLRRRGAGPGICVAGRDIGGCREAAGAVGDTTPIPARAGVPGPFSGIVIPWIRAEAATPEERCSPFAKKCLWWLGEGAWPVETAHGTRAFAGVWGCARACARIPGWSLVCVRVCLRACVLVCACVCVREHVSLSCRWSRAT